MKTRVPTVTTVFGAATLAAVLVVCGTGSAWAGSVKGKVKLDGPAPQRRQLQMSADPKCEAANPGGRQGEVYVVGGDGGMQYVFVYVKDGLAQKPATPPATPATIDQHGCMYSPHVLGIMVGQDLEIKNSDPTLHNIHALPTVNTQFNNAMPLQNQTIKKKFTKPEVMVHVKCDVHPWMSAYIGVLDHPYYAVSAADGTFEIKDLPAGTYTIEAWHEAAGTQTQQVTVPADGAATADFSFKPGAAPGA
jgi:plastocyanin